jgi:division protein CdvB (Snf7/Vps24/ESCRT-III family)
MKNKEQIIIELNRLSTFIEEAQIKLGDGEVVNLSHLDDEVETICQEIIRLPAAEAQAVQPVMADMIGKLETLGLSLQEFQKKLKGE